MRVLQALGARGNGGAETFFTTLVRALGDRGLDQTVVMRRNPVRDAAFAKAGIRPLHLPFGGPLDLFTPLALRRIARRSGVSVALTWMNRATARLPAGPYVRAARLGGYYNLKYYRHCDHLVVNTPLIRDHCVNNGYPADRISVIPNFAEAPDPAVPPVDRAAHGTPASVPVLLGLGRLHDNKAHDISLRALQQVPDAHLWIAGDGPQQAELIRLAAQLGVADRVRFLGWRADRTALMRAADVCLFPSRVEPFGNVTVEAWAHRLPIIAAASDGPAAQIRDGADGFLVPVDDAEALAERTRALLAAPERRAALASAGEARWRAEYSEAAVVDRYLDMFRMLATGESGTRPAGNTLAAGAPPEPDRSNA